MTMQILPGGITIKGQCYLDGKEISTEEAIGMILEMGRQEAKTDAQKQALAFAEERQLKWMQQGRQEEKARLIRVIERNKFSDEQVSYQKENEENDCYSREYNNKLLDQLLHSLKENE